MEVGPLGASTLKINPPFILPAKKKKKSIYLGITELQSGSASHSKTVTKSNQGEKHYFTEKEEVGRGCLEWKPIREKKRFRAVRCLIGS